jgi:hypothetical protein
MKPGHDALNREAAQALASELWRRIQADWSSEPVHQEFVALCDDLEIWDWAAKRYAETRTQRPGDPLARRMLGQILLLAQVRLDGARSKRKAPPRGSKIRTTVLLLLLLLLPLLMMLGLIRRWSGLESARAPGSNPSVGQGVVQIQRR